MMDNGALIAAIAMVSAAASAIVAYLLGRRDHSGTVNTTDAEKLWEQNGKLISALTTDNQHLRDDNARMQDRVRDLELKQVASERAEYECSKRNDELAAKVARLEQKLGAEGASL